jgi:hypothetical protein
MDNLTIEVLENQWKKSIKRLGILYRCIALLQEEDKDHPDILILRKRCITLHYERISINQQILKINIGKVND